MDGTEGLSLIVPVERFFLCRRITGGRGLIGTCVRKLRKKSRKRIIHWLGVQKGKDADEVIQPSIASRNQSTTACQRVLGNEVAVMRPLSQLRTIAPDTPAIQALEIMSREDINQLPVLSNARLEGIFSRRHILGFLQNHAELYRR